MEFLTLVNLTPVVQAKLKKLECSVDPKSNPFKTGNSKNRGLGCSVFKCFKKQDGIQNVLAETVLYININIYFLLIRWGI